MPRLTLPLSLVLLASLASPAARAAAPDHWVGTWSASPVAAPNVPPAASANATTPPSAPPAPPLALLGTSGQTLREIVHVSIGGSLVRIVLTNEFGVEPLTIAAAHIALRPGGITAGSEVQLTSANALTFNGQPSVIIPPGVAVLSDPVALKLPALSDLAISLYVPAQPLTSITQHGAGYQTNYAVDGNHVGDKTLDDPRTFFSWRFVKEVDVMAPASSAAVVTLGDSITDGTASPRDANARWPNVLAARLQSNKKTAGIAVLNEGIGGNRLLNDVTGPSALSRFDRDVLSHPGVRYLIILEGINDIGRTAQPNKPGDPITTPQLLLALQQLIDRAHAHGIKVYGATLTPFVGARYATPEGEVMRQAENAFIRSGKFDAILDFDKATQDPAHPAALLPANDSGDHLHPKAEGYKAMGNSIDLKLFSK